jgi:putative ABC transport system permease protein
VTPPRLAARLVRWAAGRERARFVLNDLDEEFGQVVRARGRAAAHAWYWRQALSSLLPLAAIRLGGMPRLSARHVRDSLRVFRQSPGMSLSIVTTLALGIGANTAVFSVVDAVLLRPLPYPDAPQLFALWERRPDMPRMSVSLPNFEDYARATAGTAELAAFSRATAVVGQGVSAEELPVERISWNLWQVLGVSPAMGRALTAEDGRRGAEAVAVVSDRFWRERMGGVPGAIGTTVMVDRVARRVIAVLPSAARGLSDYSASAPAGLFLPVPDLGAVMSRGDREVRAVGRLRPDATLLQVQQRLNQVSATLAREFPETNTDVLTATAPLSRDLSRIVRPTLLMVWGAVALIGLIACVNVANLFLVWATGQRRDAAIRLALGASRADLVLGHLVRGVMFGCVGGVAGLLCSVWVRDALVALAPATVIPQIGGVTLNGRVLLMTAGLSMLTGLAASIVPAWQFGRHRLAGGLHESSMAVVGTRAVMRWRGALLTVEVTAAVVLALGAGLLVRSVILLDRTDLGFATDRIVTMGVRLPPLRYGDAEQRIQLFEALAARVRSAPDVHSVAFANQFPMRGGWGGDVLVESPSGPVSGEADLQAVSPDYFSTLGLRLVRGRALTRDDRTGSPGMVVVSQAFVGQFLGGREPLGAVIRRDTGSPPLTIAGVVADVRRDGKFAPVTPQVYLSAYQPELYAATIASIAVRTAGDPMRVLPHVRAALADLDPAALVSGVRTLDEILNASSASLRFHTSLLALLAALALVLTLVGVYGVVHYVVAQRTREIGLRLALGATRGHVLGVAVRAGMGPVAAGVLIGCAAAAGASRVLTALLFETTRYDPVMFILVAGGVGTVAAIAAYVPARRAAAANPVSALRGD